ncbi:proteasome assembly chaperone 1 [Suncus etruscus]|uniref:proteasome assembly chaperone 1 n=1 Tax=Suncus etruscus TaxID=109475 RepID=UPI002110DEEC|nr:proteasome assembly chaperone 1 [Suncus etruscus]
MAATFFGEVVWSRCRAGTEDEEEAAEEEGARATFEDGEVRRQRARKREVRLLRTQTKTSWDVPLLEKYPCSKFILAIGNNAVAFLSSFVMNSGDWEEVGCAELWNEWCRATDTMHMSPAKAFCIFYYLQSNPSVMLCQCSCYVAEDQQFQWLEKVFGSCPRKNMQVTVLTSRHVTDYKTSAAVGSFASPFLRALKTRDFHDSLCCALLEPPNFAHDLPAAVLSHCQVWRIPAVLYLCYTDVMRLDPVTVGAFQPLLRSSSLRTLVKNVSQSREILKKLTTTMTTEVQSNIYT